MEKFKFITGLNFEKLPKTSGVYLFYGPNPKPYALSPIYIGKAINIKSRVKNHFQQSSYRDNLFIDKVNKIGYIETNSEIEALILEANLIKKHQPKFNVVWKDDKNYFYVAIVQNKDKIPFVYITHQPSFAKASEGQAPKYIGPFVEGTALKKTLKYLRRAFPYYTQAKHPKTQCTWCHLGLCPGPHPDLPAYKNNLKKLTLILQGKRSAVLNSLKREMRQFSNEHKFEEAGKIRDRISNLQQIMSHRGVISNSKEIVTNLTAVKNAPFSSLTKIQNAHRIECYDISNIQGKFATGSMVVFTNGVADKGQYKKFKIKMGDTPNDIAMLKEVLTRRFNHPEWKYSEVILIDGGKAQLNIAIKVKKQFNKIIPLIISIAKGRRELFIEGKDKPIPLKNLPREIYNLVLQLDNEAHRFAVTYHKKLRKKSLLQ
ncbi:MAG: UvrB/UvrC motif-containing protein [Candidatus Staskawiczbacteria bacterium]|jgi:excinuclease ABC subunit C